MQAELRREVHGVEYSGMSLGDEKGGMKQSLSQIGRVTSQQNHKEALTEKNSSQAISQSSNSGITSSGVFNTGQPEDKLPDTTQSKARDQDQIKRQSQAEEDSVTPFPLSPTTTTASRYSQQARISGRRESDILYADFLRDMR
jgi:hypothetical protein